MANFYCPTLKNYPKLHQVIGPPPTLTQHLQIKCFRLMDRAFVQAQFSEKLTAIFITLSNSKGTKKKFGLALYKQSLGIKRAMLVEQFRGELI